MIIARSRQSGSCKGWYDELASQNLPAIGFATTGIDEPHRHRELHEVYLIARGSSILIVDDRRVTLNAGDVIVVEPGEGHTFVESTPDYFHFVLHCPPVSGDKVLLSQA